jgi:hypothetical protein
MDCQVGFLKGLRKVPVPTLIAKRIQRPILFLCIVLGCASLLCLGSWFFFRSPGNSRGPDLAIADAETPLAIRPLAPVLFSSDSPVAAWVARVLQGPPLTPELNVSYCCHLLRIYGLGPIHHDRFSSGRDVLRALTDHNEGVRFFGTPVFFQTRSGIRYQDLHYRHVLAGENHQDICLATFAEVGLPLTTPFAGATSSYSLRELLRDSVNNFDIRQDELSWTTIAYALYLPPEKTWINRYDESFTFDDLAKTLMRGSFIRASCGGTHILYALTMLIRTDSSLHCLSQGVRDDVFEYLKQMIKTAVESQREGGFWMMDWYRSSSRDANAHYADQPLDDLDSRLLVTGHLLEWLELLPIGLQPPLHVYRRAATWLCQVPMEGARTAAVVGAFCPHTHAVCAVRRLIEAKK